MSAEAVTVEGMLEEFAAEFLSSPFGRQCEWDLIAWFPDDDRVPLWYAAEEDDKDARPTTQGRNR